MKITEFNQKISSLFSIPAEAIEIQIENEEVTIRIKNHPVEANIFFRDVINDKYEDSVLNEEKGQKVISGIPKEGFQAHLKQQLAKIEQKRLAKLINIKKALSDIASLQFEMAGEDVIIKAADEIKLGLLKEHLKTKGILFEGTGLLLARENKSDNSITLNTLQIRLLTDLPFLPPVEKMKPIDDKKVASIIQNIALYLNIPALEVEKQIWKTDTEGTLNLIFPQRRELPLEFTHAINTILNGNHFTYSDYFKGSAIANLTSENVDKLYDTLAPALNLPTTAQPQIFAKPSAATAQPPVQQPAMTAAAPHVPAQQPQSHTPAAPRVPAQQPVTAQPHTPAAPHVPAQQPQSHTPAAPRIPAQQPVTHMHTQQPVASAAPALSQDEKNELINILNSYIDARVKNVKNLHNFELTTRSTLFRNNKLTFEKASAAIQLRDNLQTSPVLTFEDVQQKITAAKLANQTSETTADKKYHLPGHGSGLARALDKMENKLKELKTESLKSVRRPR